MSAASTSQHFAAESYAVLHAFLEAAGPVLGTEAKLQLVREVDALIHEGYSVDELTPLVQQYANLRPHEGDRRVLCGCEAHTFRAFCENGGALPSTGRVVRAWWVR